MCKCFYCFKFSASVRLFVFFFRFFFFFFFFFSLCTRSNVVYTSINIRKMKFIPEINTVSSKSVNLELEFSIDNHFDYQSEKENDFNLNCGKFAGSTRGRV